MTETSAERYIITAAGFLFCRDCGALIMEGYRDEHDRMHPRISCSQAHPGADQYCHPDGMHSWESIYPRTPDGRAGERLTP